jgi:uncharacterized protein with PIN domain
MAVPCPRCGRGYDVALFQFGRTIHCACGTRVGMEPRVRPSHPPGPARFAVDAMLGRLARWLRFVGCDATFDADVRDADLAREAIEQGRVLLTRDAGMLEEWRLPRALLVGSERLPDQLRQVVETFAIDWRVGLFTRCSRCNALLEDVSREAVAGRVPPRIFEEEERFLRCPACGRVYWHGSHVDRVRRAIEHALAA